MWRLWVFIGTDPVRGNPRQVNRTFRGTKKQADRALAAFLSESSAPSVGLLVGNGLASTARVITAAAAIMIAVFLSFVLGDVRVLKLMGLGLATAIFVDATLVRMVLVPATMELLGNANWWLSRWLDRLIPRISVEVPPDFVLEAAAGAAVDEVAA